VPTVLVDTGVWCALCDDRDRVADREFLDALPSRMAPHSTIVPWPIAYETLRTRFARNRVALARFRNILRSPGIVLFDDRMYREDALELCIKSGLMQNRPLSMADCLLRLMLDDIEVRISYMITLNIGDFADVCARRKVEIWSG
jgi:predicted nucleic acid-binding protein